MATVTHELALGFDLGGTKLAGALVDPATGTVLARTQVPTVFEEDRLVDEMVGLADVLSTMLPDGIQGRIACAGLGAPGLVDRDGVLRYGANLPGVLDAPLALGLSQRLNVPVAAENDATCAAWAEHRVGAARGHAHALIITLGTGIGGGIIADGQLVRGGNGFAGEPGHMVIDPAGPECPCGRRGCWERLGSGTALGRMGREAVAAGRGEAILRAADGAVDAIVGEHVSRAAAAGDADAQQIMERFGWLVAAGTANLVALLDSRIVVLSGGLADLGELLMEPVRRHFAGLVYGGERRPTVAIEAARLGSAAGVIGAALLGVERLGELDPAAARRLTEPVQA